MLNAREIVYKDYNIHISYEEECKEYLIQVSSMGRDRLFYCTTVDDYVDYGEDGVFDRAIFLYNQRISIMEQIG